MFAKLVGEGYERPDGDDEIPLDINYGKVGEWLVDRKLIPTDWAKRLQAIQAKAAEAATELPSGFLNQFDGGEESAIDYLKSKHILAKLTETAERNMLGSLKGTAGTWERIVKAYEANLLQIAEAGLTMQRSVDYDIPYFKKQAAKNQQLIADLDKKAADAMKSAAAAAIDFQRECQSIGITPPPSSANKSALFDSLRVSLLDLTLDLPTILTEALSSIQDNNNNDNAALIGKAMDYYKDFTQSSLSTIDTDAMLSVLSEVRHSKTSPPSQQCTLGRALLDTTNTSNTTTTTTNAIDWGMVDTTPASDESATTTAAGAISWDIEVETVVESSSHVDGDGTAGISWDIDISDVGEASIVVDDIVENNNISSSTAATASNTKNTTSNTSNTNTTAEVQRIIVDKEYRSKLLDDLYELKAFLTQRSIELSNSTNQLLSTTTTSSSSVDVPAVRAMLSATEHSITALTESRVMQLLSLLSSEAYRERMVAKVAQQAGQETKFKRAATDAGARKQQAQRSLMEDSTKLASLVRHTKEVKTVVEVGLGNKLKRRINVQGEINSLLSQM